MKVIDLLKDRQLAIRFRQETHSKVTMLKHVVNVVFDILILLFLVNGMPGIFDFFVIITFPFFFGFAIFLNIYDFKLRWKSFKG